MSVMGLIKMQTNQPKANVILRITIGANGFLFVRHIRDLKKKLYILSWADAPYSKNGAYPTILHTYIAVM